MTQETKKEIAALYADKSNKVHDIAAAYKINPNQLTKIVLEMGGELRRPKSTAAAKAGFKNARNASELSRLRARGFARFARLT